jgi:hypothetical protein
MCLCVCGGGGCEVDNATSRHTSLVNRLVTHESCVFVSFMRDPVLTGTVSHVFTYSFVFFVLVTFRGYFFKH